MKTVKQATIIGQVQEVKQPSQDGYLIDFVIKVIREGEAAWFNITASPWKNWNLNLKEGDQIKATGQMIKKVWEDPFSGEELITLEMDATDVSILAA